MRVGSPVYAKHDWHRATRQRNIRAVINRRPNNVHFELNDLAVGLREICTSAIQTGCVNCSVLGEIGSEDSFSINRGRGCRTRICCCKGLEKEKLYKNVKHYGAKCELLSLMKVPWKSGCSHTRRRIFFYLKHFGVLF